MKTFFNKRKLMSPAVLPLPTVYVFLSIILLTITLFPLFTLCLYNHPQNLDNYRTYYFYEQTGFNYNILQKLIPGTRFIGYLIGTPLLKIPETLTIKNIDSLLAVYRLFSFFMIILFCAAFLFFIQKVNKFYLKLAYPNFIFLYSLLLFIIINSLKRIDLFFYEMVTSAGYTAGLILFFIYTGILIEYYYRKKILYAGFSFVLAFLLCGTIEYFTVLAGYMAFLFLVTHFVKEKRLSIPILFQLVYCIIVFYLFIRNPDNAAKVAGYSGESTNPYSTHQLINWTKNIVYEFFDVWVFLVQSKLIPCFILIAVLLKDKIPPLNRYSFLFIVMNYLLCVTMAFAIFVSSVSDFNWMPSTIQIPYTLMIFNTVILLFFLISLLAKKYTLISVEQSQNPSCIFTYPNIVSVSIVLFYFLIISIVQQGLPVRQAWKDILKGTAQNYDTQVQQLYTEIKKSADDIVTVKEITDVPITLITSNLTSNLWSSSGTYTYQKDYYTQALAPFFLKKEIIITGQQNNE